MTSPIDGIDAPEGVVALLLDDLTPPRLGTLLRGARKRGAHTRREVAARVGTTRGELRRYERGDAPVPARIIASLAECYGTDLTSQLATRAPLEVAAHHVVVGTQVAQFDSVDDEDEVLEKYAHLVQRLRNSQPGEPIALRAADLVALSSALGHDAAHVEARIVELLGCTPREARSLHAEMLRRKLVVPVAGLVAGLAVVTGAGIATAHTGASTNPAQGQQTTVATLVTVPAAHSVAAPPTTAPPTTAPATAVTTPETDAPAPAEVVATPTTQAPEPAPAPAVEAPAVAPLPRPVITPDTTPMSIPPHETVTIIQP